MTKLFATSPMSEDGYWVVKKSEDKLRGSIE
jgi:hypothetical protein